MRPEALVLIHGASGNLRDFAFEFLDALTAHPAGAGRRVIAIDRPGTRLFPIAVLAQRIDPTSRRGACGGRWRSAG